MVSAMTQVKLWTRIFWSVPDLWKSWTYLGVAVASGAVVGYSRSDTGGANGQTECDSADVEQSAGTSHLWSFVHSKAFRFRRFGWRRDHPRTDLTPS